MDHVVISWLALKGESCGIIIVHTIAILQQIRGETWLNSNFHCIVIQRIHYLLAALYARNYLLFYTSQCESFIDCYSQFC